MNRTYLIKGSNVLKLVDELDVFETKIEPFLKEHPDYSYTKDLYHDGEYWVVKIHIDNGTGEEKTFREIIQPS